jgi:signal transduction histidine kinase
VNRRGIAARLSLIVALAGILPIAIVGLVSVELLRRRVERASQQALQVIAEQVAQRTAYYLANQQQLLRAVASVANDEGRLEEVILDAPGLGRVSLLQLDTPQSRLPKGLGKEALAAITERKEVRSKVYSPDDSSSAMDICVPARALGPRAACAQLDLRELWRFIMRIKIGSTGYVLAFDEAGRLIAAGLGALRPAVVTGEGVPQSQAAASVAKGEAAGPTRYQGADGEPVIAAWSRLPALNWAIAVEQPTREALRSARTAQWLLALVLILALTMSLAVGVWESQRVLRELEIEERWRTAGRIASGISHDLGHRLRILEQTAALADAGDPAFLPRIRDNLRTELETLKKFVSEFSDLSRNLRSLELIPLELGAFLQSVRLTAGPYVQSANIRLQVQGPDVPLWVKADRHMLERAILNLITNAMEASPPGATVQVSTIHAPGECGIEVVDRGDGIAPERIPQLFDAFDSTKRTGAHLGMGLPNVKRIVEAHGGKISVQSSLKVGTTFRIMLFECPPPGKEEPARRRAQPSSSSGPSSRVRP